MDTLERKAGNEDNSCLSLGIRDSVAVGGVGFDKDVLLELLIGLSRAAGSTRTYRWKAHAVSVDMLTELLERVQMLAREACG
jgi:hypothetical protein